MERYLFDSSTLIASFVQNHPKHPSAFLWYKRAKQGEIDFYVSAHSLLEVYSVLTSAPFKPRISAQGAWELIDSNIKQSAQIISLSEHDYFKILNRVYQKGLVGGIIYDAIMVECAIKKQIGKILTSNSKDFVRLISGEDTIEIIGI